MGGKSNLAEIGILIYPGAQLAAVYGLTDLLTIASDLAQEKAGSDGAMPDRPILRVSHWQPAQGAATVACCQDTHPGLANEPVYLLIPPSLIGPPDAEMMARLASWLKERHGTGVT